MTKAEIIARLQNGETMDDIAVEISTMMTEAEDEYAAIQKAEEEAKSAAADKALDAANLGFAISNFLNKWYPGADIEGFPASGSEIIDWFDSVLELKSLTEQIAHPEVKVIHSNDASGIIKSLFRAL